MCMYGTNVVSTVLNISNLVKLHLDTSEKEYLLDLVVDVVK